MKKLIALAFMLLMVVCSLNAQNTKQIKGKVVDDSTGNPLPGTSINVAGTRKAVKADDTGNYTINIPDDGKKHDLTFSFAGYLNKIVSTDATNVNVHLVQEIRQGEEVVVIGYQTVKRKDALASVSSVNAKDLKDIPINSVAEALNERLAGVTATTAEGSPDAEVRVRVRNGISITGDNSPLYIVDGVQVENGLSSVVLQDIQSIDVLKDAAATAIYGARGANGVIIITTKSGKAGKLKVTYNGFYGIKYLPKTLGVLKPKLIMN